MEFTNFLVFDVGVPVCLDQRVYRL